MNLEKGKTYSGFKLVDEKEIKEINSKAFIFQHEKTAAKLLKLSNEDDNKVFSIAFRTPPKDSTGVAHILEHSVLCGSRKFPVKEPFVELIKGSLNTFLNAMTFADKTMYPIASRNKKDFFNLIDVYLDAVFYPDIYKYPEIFMQEGWHYEIEDENQDMEYKGVVYNEMKGAFSSPESILMRKIPESLYPNTTYGVESGGDPEFIPDLTYEQFIDFHKKYYHPSNSYIFLYGDGDTLEELAFIEDNYLCQFNKTTIDSKIRIQPKFDKIRESVVNYPISSNEDEKDKTFLSLNFSVGRATDKELSLALDILEHLLLETPAAPLKKALIQSKIGKDVFGVYDNSILQPNFSIVVKNSNEDKKEEFKDLVYKTLKRLVEQGIDKKLIESSINIKEFQLREADFQGFPKGLMYGIRCMDSWLYDEDPLMHLSYEPQLNAVKRALSSDYFERIIRDYILNNSHSSLLVVKPKKGLAEEKDKETKEKLKAYKEGLSKKELEKIIEDTKRLKERQITPDSQEDLKKIPLLTIDDIEKTCEKISLHEEKIKGIKVLKHNSFTNKIAYIKLYFNTEGLSKDLIPYLGLLTGLIGKIDTEKYSYEELSNEVNINTGGISYSVTAYSNSKKLNEFTPMLKVKSKVLVEKIPKLFDLLVEEIVKSKYDNYDRINEIISEMKSRMEMVIFDRGHMITAGRLTSYFSAVSNYLEKASELDFYHSICEIQKNFKENKEDVIEKLKQVAQIVFNKKNLIVGITIGDEDYEKFEEALPELLNNLKDNKVTRQSYEFEPKPLNEGLMTSGKVQYNSKGYSYKTLGYEYKGSMQVLKSIVSYDYLWNKVRVQGGAYGCFAGFTRSGNAYFVSYRDPGLKETLEVYNDLPKYIENFKTDEREMTKYIIGTISDIDSPLTPSMKGETAISNYFSNITYEDLQRERDEILSTTEEDIRNLAKLVDECLKKDYICVLGGEEKIENNKNLFNTLTTVFK